MEFKNYLSNSGIVRKYLRSIMEAGYECCNPIRKASRDELFSLCIESTKHEHLMRGDWETNHDEILSEANDFCLDVIDGSSYAYTYEGHGIVIFGPNDKTNSQYIFEIYVDPEYRGQGIGTQLMQYALDMFPDDDFALTVNSLNQAAISLYAKLGFKEDRRYSYDGYDLIVMRLSR